MPLEGGSSSLQPLVAETSIKTKNTNGTDNNDSINVMMFYLLHSWNTVSGRPSTSDLQ